MVLLTRILIGLAASLLPAVSQTAPVDIVFTTRTPTWSTGFNADIVITNHGTADIIGWTVAFDLPVSGFSDTWNANEGASTATRKIFSNISTNATIRAGASRSFGFTAAGAYTVDATNFTFNELQPAGSSPTLSISDVSEDEGNAPRNLIFSVTLSGASSEAVTLDWASADGTATAGEDYTGASGSLNFAPGEISKSITVRIVGDTEGEADETFFLILRTRAAP